jgi:hypothetical protein
MRVLILALCSQSSIPAQREAASSKPNVGSVPFVGCKSDGQLGPAEAPAGSRKNVSLPLQVTQQLAYYRSAQGVGVLAPRGWYCYGTYGSGGETLFVSPQPIDAANIFSPRWAGFSGPAIEIGHRYGDTSGRFAVAEIIARVFPAYKEFVVGVSQMSDAPVDSFTFGPYPEDKLMYKSKRVVEYETPAQAEGLGTRSSLKKNGRSIKGVAMLVGPTPDLLLLSVRLPLNLAGLTASIVLQVKRGATGDIGN